MYDILNIIEDWRGLNRKPIRIEKDITVGEFRYHGQVPVCMYCNKVLVNSPTIDCDCELFKSGRLVPPETALEKDDKAGKKRKRRNASS